MPARRPDHSPPKGRLLQTETACNVVILYERDTHSIFKLQRCTIEVFENYIILTTDKVIVIRGKDLRSSAQTNIRDVLHIGTHKLDLLLIAGGTARREGILRSLNTCRGVGPVSEQHAIDVPKYLTFRYPTDVDVVMDLLSASTVGSTQPSSSKKLPFPITLKNRVGIHKRPKGTKTQRWYRDLEIDHLHKQEQLDYLRRGIPFSKSSTLVLEMDILRLQQNAAYDRVAESLRELQAAREAQQSQGKQQRIMLNLYVQILEEKERNSRENVIADALHEIRGLSYQFDLETDIVAQHDAERHIITTELDEKIKFALAAVSQTGPSISIPKTPIFFFEHRSGSNLCLSEQVGRSRIISDYLDELPIQPAEQFQATLAVQNAESSKRWVIEANADHEYNLLLNTSFYYNFSIDLSVNALRDLLLQEWSTRKDITRQHIVAKITLCSELHPDQQDPTNENSELMLNSIFGTEDTILAVRDDSSDELPQLQLNYDSSEDGSQKLSSSASSSTSRKGLLKLEYDSSECGSQKLLTDSGDESPHQTDLQLQSDSSEDGFLPVNSVSISELYYDESLSEDDLLMKSEDDDESVGDDFVSVSSSGQGSDDEDLGSSQADFFYCPVHKGQKPKRHRKQKQQTVEKEAADQKTCRICSATVPRKMIPDTAPTWGKRSAATSSNLVGVVDMAEFEDNCLLVRETRSKVSFVRSNRDHHVMKKLLLAQQQWGLGTYESFPVKTKLELSTAARQTDEMLTTMLHGILRRQKVKKQHLARSVAAHCDSVCVHAQELIHHQQLHREWAENKAEIAFYRNFNIATKKLLRIAQLPHDSLERESDIPDQRRLIEDLELQASSLENQLLRTHSKAAEHEASSALHNNKKFNTLRLRLTRLTDEVTQMKMVLDQKMKIAAEDEETILKGNEHLHALRNRNIDQKNEIEAEEDKMNSLRRKYDKTVVMTSEMRREIQNLVDEQQRYYATEHAKTSPLVRMWKLHTAIIENVELSKRSIIQNECHIETARICSLFQVDLTAVQEKRSQALVQQGYHIIDLIGSQEALKHQLKDVAGFLTTQTVELKKMEPSELLANLQLCESDERREVLSQEGDSFFDIIITSRKRLFFRSSRPVLGPVSPNPQNRFQPASKRPPSSRSMLNTLVMPNIRQTGLWQ
eukprot:TRINITY_DN27731_c0_g1_i1.p1 TRINITY_DN27731_c0_g1~~TRINITY_DN27731_c0_g1_i1.p1  ORF type:complete len:1176 (+),score=207.23 TRINITY_DN27731_c0_g1_i1:67-3528(+)